MEAGHYLRRPVPGHLQHHRHSERVQGAGPTDVIVGANVVTNTHFNLQVGGVSEKISVEADAVMLQTEKTHLHTELTEKAIQEMPLNQYRNYQTLINLVPGATPGVFQNAIAEHAERALTPT